MAEGLLNLFKKRAVACMSVYELPIKGVPSLPMQRELCVYDQTSTGKGRPLPFKAQLASLTNHKERVPLKPQKNWTVMILQFPYKKMPLAGA